MTAYFATMDIQSSYIEFLTFSKSRFRKRRFTRAEIQRSFALAAKLTQKQIEVSVAEELQIHTFIIPEDGGPGRPPTVI